MCCNSNGQNYVDAARFHLIIGTYNVKHDENPPALEQRKTSWSETAARIKRDMGDTREAPTSRLKARPGAIQLGH